MTAPGHSDSATPSVLLVEWQRDWLHIYAKVATELLRTMPRLIVGIEHIGSTSVVGLRSKPVVDVALGVRALDMAGECAVEAERIGFRRRDEFADVGRVFLERHLEGATAVHVHICEHGGHHWCRYVGVRDALRADAALRERYESLKRALAEQFSDDRAAYSAAKTEFIRAIERELPGLGGGEA